MKTIAFFNNKGAVGTTSLVYHLAWMFGELERRILAVDLDPQANLSGIFLEEERLEELWSEQGDNTIDEDIAPLFEGTGDIAESPHIEKVTEKTGLVAGKLSLSKREDELSAQWPKCLDGDERAFRVTTAFARLIERAGEEWGADLALVDVGPNLGAINRAALIASDYVVVPLAPDLFSLQGLRNVGPTLKNWRDAWERRLKEKPGSLDVTLPSGNMKPVGYVVMQPTVRLDGPVKAYARWIKQIPGEYRESVMEDAGGFPATGSKDPNRLAQLKDYRFLMQMAQEVDKPMFMLKPADGAIGAHQSAVRSCYKAFKKLANQILNRIE